MAPKPFTIEISSNSSDSVAASSNAMHNVVPIEEEVTSKAKETYSDNDGCIVAGERWNKKEWEENDASVIVGETLQINPSYGGPQPIYNLQAAHPEHVYSSGPLTPGCGCSGYVQRLCPTLPSSSSVYKPKGKLVIRRPLRNIPPSSSVYKPKGKLVIRIPLRNIPSSSSVYKPKGKLVIRRPLRNIPSSSSVYKPKGKLVIRTPLRNMTRSKRAMSASSSTESDRTGSLDAHSSTESDRIGAPPAPSSADTVLIAREHGYKAKGKLVIHSPLRNRAMITSSESTETED